MLQRTLPTLPYFYSEQFSLSLLMFSLLQVSTLMHPSPINPAANKGWRDIAINQLTQGGVLHYFKP